MHRKSQAKEVRKKAGRQINVLSDQTEENLKDWPSNSWKLMYQSLLSFKQDRGIQFWLLFPPCFYSNLRKWIALSSKGFRFSILKFKNKFKGEHLRSNLWAIASAFHTSNASWVLEIKHSKVGGKASYQPPFPNPIKGGALYHEYSLLKVNISYNISKHKHQFIHICI